MMSPDERAAKIIEANDFLLDLREGDRAALQAVIAAAIMAERQRCIRTCRQFYTGMWHESVGKPMLDAIVKELELTK
jgi:hypothetical protein